MQAARPAIVIHDRAGSIIGWDERATEVLGYSAPEAVGRSLSLILVDGLLTKDTSAVHVCKTKDERLLRVLWSTSDFMDGTDAVLASVTALTVLEEPSSPLAATEPEPALESVRVAFPERATSLLESLVLMLWKAREGGQTTFVNHRFRAYAGVTAEPGRAADWLDLVHPDERQDVRAQWQRCLASRAEFRSECRLRRHDGSFRWFDVRGGACGDPADGEWCFVGTDVDETHALHVQLRADQERLKSIMESSPGVVFSYETLPDGTLKVTFVSSVAREVYGYTPDEIVENTPMLLQRVHPEDAIQVSAATEEALRAGGAWHGEYRYDHPVEGEKWLEAHFGASRAADGRVTWSGIVFDITERKHDEQQLAVVRGQLEKVLDAAEMGVWVLQIEKNLLWGNESQRKLWGVSADVPGWYSPEIIRAQIHPDDRPHVDEQFARARATGEPLDLEFRRRTADGSYRWTSLRSQTECGADGQPLRLMGIDVDVTRKKQLADAALRSQKLEALGTLASGIAHDFNNMLYAISGNAALALDRVAKTSGTYRFLQVIASASERASELVRQILTFSQPQVQKLEVLDLAEPVREGLRLARATLRSTTSIHAELDPDTPAVLADASHLVQLVLNLCTNAAQAIGQGNVGAIELRLEPVTLDRPEQELGKVRLPSGTYALLTVSDNGCGMDEQTQARIFDPFFTTRGPGAGTGLGLSVAHGIVTALGGTITVHSQVGKGSTFRVYFPVASGPGSAARPATARRFGRGQEILLVDDESIIMELGREMLVTLGYRPTAFEDPKAALAAFRKEPRRFAAMVTDLSMPVMSGFDLSREVLAIRADLPILLISGYVGPDERAAAAQIGVRALALKPLSMERMSELLAELCRGA